MTELSRQSALDDPHSRPADRAYEIYRIALDVIYEEAKKETTRLLLPDAAVRMAGERIASLVTEEYQKEYQERARGIGKPLKRPRMDAISVRRMAHHYAVDLFYRTHFPRKGPPPVPQEDIARMLELHNQGKSYALIGNSLQITKEAARKRIKAALAKQVDPPSLS